jgi:hypothetical protein
MLRLETLIFVDKILRVLSVLKVLRVIIAFEKIAAVL